MIREKERTEEELRMRKTVGGTYKHKSSKLCDKNEFTNPTIQRQEKCALLFSLVMASCKRRG